MVRAAGNHAKVLVDIGHHYQAQNVEQIIAWLLSKDRLGGFHLNDRSYADDDLTLASVNPYRLFRIFHDPLESFRQSGYLDRISQRRAARNKTSVSTYA